MFGEDLLIDDDDLVVDDNEHVISDDWQVADKDWQVADEDGYRRSSGEKHENNFGAVAQLGERSVRNAEAGSSTLLRSIL